MLKIKQLTLKNYAGYSDEVKLDFFKSDGSHKNVCVLFGPNGCGKSTALQSINILGRAKMYENRSRFLKTSEEQNLLLRKFIYSQNYDPTWVKDKEQNQMNISALFTESNKDLLVEINNDGVITNDLKDRQADDNVIYTDADNPINLANFQIFVKNSARFIDFAKTVYGYNCYLDKLVDPESVNEKAFESNLYKNIDKDSINDDDMYTDFVLDKGKTKCRYKSFSGGERKLATLASFLFNSDRLNKSDVVLIDNVEKEVYIKRQPKMIDKLVSQFPDKQFIVTSHSETLIRHIENNYGSDCLFDIAKLKGEEMID